MDGGSVWLTEYPGTPGLPERKELFNPILKWSNIEENCNNKAEDIMLSLSSMDLFTVSSCAVNLASKSTFGAVDQKGEVVFNKDYSYTCS